LENVKMVDISLKKIVKREALASGEVIMKPETIKLIKENKLRKGDCLTLAKIGGIGAVKKTNQLLPLCHPLTIDWIDIKVEVKEDRIKVLTKVKAEGKTGVEMEALTGTAIACLTIYDMCKGLDKTIIISELKLEEKSKDG
jgi:cyclic pyranopterin phosphate synthase